MPDMLNRTEIGVPLFEAAAGLYESDGRIHNLQSVVGLGSACRSSVTPCVHDTGPCAPLSAILVVIEMTICPLTSIPLAVNGSAISLEYLSGPPISALRIDLDLLISSLDLAKG